MKSSTSARRASASFPLRTALTLAACAIFAASASHALGSAQEAQTPSGSAPAEPSASEVVFVGAGGLELRGTLVLPALAEGARCGALLLMPGSGPTDRDGNQLPLLETNVLKQIAEHLQAQGVASLRFDKRAVGGYARSWPKDPSELGTFFGYENFIGDATAAYRHLGAHARVDAQRVALLGHSEGGLFALQIARNLVGTPEQPAGLVLAATAGRPLDVVLREQIANALAQQTSDEAVRTEMMAQLERGIEAAKQRAPIPADLPVGLQPLFNPSAAQLLHAYFTIDPAQLASEVRGPVLVLQGELDVQISVERDAPRLLEALGRRSGQVQVLERIPHASHNFKRVASAQEFGFTGPLLPEFLDALARWCAAQLAPAAK